MTESLKPFEFESGYKLTCRDLGDEGIVIELSHPREGTAKIILDTDTTGEFIDWLLTPPKPNRGRSRRSGSGDLQRLIDRTGNPLYRLREIDRPLPVRRRCRQGHQV